MQRPVILLIGILMSFCQKGKPVEPASTNVSTSKKVEVKEVVPKIIFFGDSLTAGKGISPIEKAYPGLIQKKLTQDGYSYSVINAGVSGDTTTSGLERLEWVIAQGVDIFVLELGANDSMRGVEPKVVESNLKEIIHRVRAKNPNVKVLLVPMHTFPNMGPIYARKFFQVYQNISSSENVPLSLFILDKIAGVKELNQADGIHPTEKGHEIMADNIYPSLKKLL